MNWGMKIVIGMGTFMLFIIGAGIYMVSHDSDSLIDDDYYEKGLVYDDTYRKKQNLLDDAAKPEVILHSDTVTFVFKKDKNKGELFFKRPSDGSLDIKVPFYTNTNVFRLPVSSFSKGNWTVEITWKSNGRNYIDTQSLFLK